MMINTFAFIDIETTGLNSVDKIVELGVLAINRSQLALYSVVEKGNDIGSAESTATFLPRIGNSLVLTFNPEIGLNPMASQINGICDEEVSWCRRLDANAAKLLGNFLLFQQQPICLIAHNGANFDFPHLKSEMPTLDGVDMKYADSLQMFRSLLSHLHSFKLAAVANEVIGCGGFGVSHRALDDCAALASCFIMLAPQSVEWIDCHCAEW